MTTSTMRIRAELPRPIASFFRAALGQGGGALGGVLAPEAAVVDNGEERSGAARAAWADEVCRTCPGLWMVKSAARGDTVVVTTSARDGRGAGHTTWSFVLAGDQIAELAVADAARIDLPRPVVAYVEAGNAGRPDALLDAFADDAVVNDQLREHWNRPAIAEWAKREIIAPKLTMHVERAVTRYDQTILTAIVDGDFDKRGLPDPLVLTFYFSTRGEKIVQLLILRNEESD